MRGAGDGEGGGRRRDSRRGGHCRVMADTASVGILRERKRSRKGPDASHSQVVDKGGWDRENSAESLVGEADRGGGD
jgi:hypothetical protein